MTRVSLRAWLAVGLLMVVWFAPGSVAAEVWPPPLPSPPWRATNPAVRGLAPTQTFRMDSVMKLADALSPAVVQVEAILKKGSSQGSGFFLGPEGYLVTNNHVMSGATQARITLSDGRTREARLLARDPVTDFALLYATAKPGETFDWLPLGDSAQVDVGQWAVALGSPLRFGNTVTVGIVSHVRRRGSRPKRPNWLKEYIQFDTAINPGSSGGALVNMSGQVVGVVTAMRKDAQGLGFAVPVNRLKQVLPRLMSGYSIKPATLALDVQPMDEALSRAFGLERPVGALLRDVHPRGPAGQAGLVAGDVVLSFDGVKIEDHADLPWLVAISKPGEPVKLEVMRDRRRLSFTAKPLLKSNWRVSKGAAGAMRAPVGAGGVGVIAISPEVTEAIKLRGLPAGLLVYVVEPGSSAYAAGLRAGMWIARVGDTPVTDPTRFHEAVAASFAQDGVVRVRAYDTKRDPRWVAWEAPAGD